MEVKNNGLIMSLSMVESMNSMNQMVTMMGNFYNQGPVILQKINDVNKKTNQQKKDGNEENRQNH